MTVKHLKCINVNSVNPFIPYFQQSEWYFEEVSGNKYLTLIRTNDSEEKKIKNIKNCGLKSEI